MTSGKPKRRRGIVLTLQGERKLRAAITHIETEECFGQKLTLEELSDRTSLDAGTVAKVLDCEQGVDRRTLQRFFRAFELELTEGDTCKPEFRQTQSASIPIVPSQTARVDWGEAFDVSIFYGRTSELASLEQWILDDHCRLIALLGMGGIGKTALSVKLSENIQSEFDYLIWRSLREAPPVEKILVDLLKFLSDQQETELADTVGESVTRLIHYLQQSRCLLVLDNVESILQGGTRAGRYREGYEDYGKLIQRLGESRHQSCLILTSREKPKEVARQEGIKRMVRSLSLRGLEDLAGQEFLKAEGLDDTDVQWKDILDYYSGNPLALKIAANTIQDLFGGDINAFLQQGAGVFGDIRDLLAQQFDRLSKMGQSVMYWLAINREPTSIEELKDDILEPISPQRLLETLESLRKRSLAEYAENGFTLQNVVMEYLTERFISQIAEEIQSQKFALFNSHALLKAISKDYVREAQVRLILRSLISCVHDLEEKITISLRAIRQDSNLSTGYAAGNLLNILCHTQSKVSHFDFSNLTLRQIHLDGMIIHSLKLDNSYLINPTFTKTFSNIYTVAFSPDSALFAIGDTNGAVQLWQTGDQKFLGSFDGHVTRIRAVVFCPNGKFLASCSEDSTVRLWDIQKRNCVHVFEDHISVVRAIAFSDDGNFLASGSVDHTVRIWDVKQGQCFQVLTGHISSVLSVAFSPDGKHLVSGGDDSTIRFWDIQTGQCIKVLVGHTKGVLSIAFSPDSRFLISGSEDSTVRLWNVSKGLCIKVFSEHINWVWAVAFSPDGNFFVSSSEDCTIRLWDVQKLQCSQILTGHTKRVVAVALSPNEKFLISGSYDATVRLWDIRQKQCIQVLTGYINGVWSVALSPNGKTLTSGSYDSQIRLWDIQQRQCTYTLRGHSSGIWSTAFSPSGKLLASSGDDRTIRLWDIQTRQCIRVFNAHANGVRSVSFSPDSRLLASSSDDSTIRLWDIALGKCIHVFEGHTNWVWAVTFSPDSKLLASSSNDSTIRLWDISNHQCVQILEGPTYRGVWSIAFSPDNQFLASGGSEDGNVRLWDLHKFQCAHLFSGHTSFVRTVAFSPDGHYLASGSGDATIRLWDVQQHLCLNVLIGHTRFVRSLVFSPDGKCLISASEDGTIRLWDVLTGECQTIFQIPRPYEGTSIVGIKGLTDAQRSSMLAFGAIEHG
ncbi:MAG: NB-ARC domain-containing protein [Cyanobacteria bacterium P01_D01_bin.56]